MYENFSFIIRFGAKSFLIACLIFQEINEEIRSVNDRTISLGLIRFCHYNCRFEEVE